MASINLGKVGITPGGAWSGATTNYEYLDTVTYSGSSYMVILQSGLVPAGTLPTNEAYWQKLAAKGDQGIQGIQGIQGVKGDQGDQGIQGQQGVKGDPGDPFFFSFITEAASITVAAAHENKMVKMSNAVAANITIHPDSTLNLPIGFTALYKRNGAGSVTFVPGAGVTLTSAFSFKSIAAQYNWVTITKEAANTWSMEGSLIP